MWFLSQYPATKTQTMQLEWIFNIALKQNLSQVNGWFYPPPRWDCDRPVIVPGREGGGGVLIRTKVSIFVHIFQVVVEHQPGLWLLGVQSALHVDSDLDLEDSQAFGSSCYSSGLVIFTVQWSLGEIVLSCFEIDKPFIGTDLIN